MKASTFCFSAILVCASLFTSKAFALTYSVRSDSGTQCYRLEAPAGYTPDQKHLNDPNVGYNKGWVLPISADAAAVAAVAWAGGHDEIDKSAGIGVSNYPNSLTNIGTKTPGGFYNAAYVHPIYTDSSNIQIGANGYNAAYVHPFHVERVEGPTSYYIVEMTGVVAGERQKLYAYVLDDGMLVRPEVVPCREVREAPVRHHHKWGGEGTKKWGGEEKKKWGGSESKKWGGAKPSPTPASTPHP